MPGQTARRRRVATAYAASAGSLWGEVFGADQLAAHARDLARRQHAVSVAPRTAWPTWAVHLPGRRLPLFRRLGDTEAAIATVRAHLLTAVRKGADVSPAGAWLLDNYFVVLEHAREVRASMSREFYRRLPKLVEGAHAGLPRIYDLAIQLVAHSDGRVDAENITQLIGAYQQVTELTLAELWALPAMLRMSLLENIRRMAQRANRDLADTEEADRWVELFTTQRDAALAATLATFVREPPDLTPAFLARFLQQLRSRHADFTPLLWLDQWIADEAMGADEAMRRSTQRLSLTQLVMANSITSLRTVANFDWAPFVERMSATEVVLRRDPAGVYSHMTFETRDRYRHVVEELATSAGMSEPDVARSVVAIAKRAAQPHDAVADGTPDAVRRHIGFYLIDGGRAEAEKAVGYAASSSQKSRRWLAVHSSLAYFGTLGLFVVIALAALISPLPGDVSIATWLAAIVLALLPASSVAVAFINQIVTVVVPPYRMPRLDYLEAVPSADRTLVVVPLLVPSLAALDEDLDRMEAQYLANRDPEIRFALLGDFLDADAERVPGDDAIVAAAITGIDALNAKYSHAGGTDAESPFYYFHRPRRWNPAERTWMGWERKRGKLAELNAFLRGGARDAFSTVRGNEPWLAKVRYVITLDADTTLPIGAAARLIGTMAHPLNRPSIDPRLNRPVRGYGIMQPRVGVSLESANRSRFAAIFSGHPGVDPYTTAVSDVYQDLFGEGSFTGKGIYDVDLFEQVTAGRFPENTLLSHDLIEGAFARAGLVTDIEVFDDYPTRYLAASRRQHRWIRGDWQLLPWLAASIPASAGSTGSLARNPLSALSRWKIADNMRRSLVPIATFIWLAASWTVLPGSPALWTIVVLISLALPNALGLTLTALRPPRQQSPQSWFPFYASMRHDAANAAAQVALSLVFLPHQAQVAADAILRTLWRLLVSRRHLLEWLTASQADRAATASRRSLWRHVGPAAVVAAALAVDAAFARPGAWAALPFAALWLASPEIMRWLGAPRHRAQAGLSAADRATALRYARVHWQYFERFVTADTHWLAPDNVQESPSETIALRTSPTNVGLQLIATVAAHELGFISRSEMADRLQHALDALAGMPRYRGHWYNWYGLTDLNVLDPPYVSTVDSGNLASHLMALAQACLTLSGQAPDEAARLETLAGRARQYAMEMDFALLYDPSRKLFSIGYDERAHRLDPSAYDLLASEARVASFVAIAKGDVPAEHWFRLGRTLTTVGGATALVSWSGSMFEYLMPLLVLPSRPSSLLDQTQHAAVDRQQMYARTCRVPWGISESAYNVRDRHLTYQYRGFGVPDLALARGLANDLVVAPYATMLAALVDPGSALRNLATLEKEGALGAYGFFDSVDYTRPEPGRRFALVRTFMAHHVGMSLVALHDTLDVEEGQSVWQRRFMADAASRSAALLLDERVPRYYVTAPAQPDVVEVPPVAKAREVAEPVVRHYGTAMTAEPRVALLGTTPYCLLITNSGAGYSRAAGMAVTRWRADATCDDTGQWIYLSDMSTGRLWSATYQPLGTTPDSYAVAFATDRVVFERRDGDIETRLEIVALPRERAEIRVVTVTNRSSEPREIELTSYAEVVLTDPDADRAHPAFQNLFIETEWVDARSALLASRRPRASGEARPWCAHVIATGAERVGDVTYETSRAHFVGRGRSPRTPQALDPGARLSGSVGAVLDPIVSLRARVHIAPKRSATVAFTTIVADTREEALQAADRYDELRNAERAISLAWTEAQVELRDHGITPSDASVFQELAGALLFPHEELRASAFERIENRRGQHTLWAHGISGDWPIVLATIDGEAGLDTVRCLLSAHAYWRTKGIISDLVILDVKPASYRQDFQDQLLSIVISSSEASGIDKPGGVFIRRSEVLSSDDVGMLRATARVHIACDGRDLSGRAPNLESTVDDAIPAPQRNPRLERPVAAVRASQPTSPDAATGNGFGRVTNDGAYEITVNGASLPPAPWINVIANPHGGFCVTERGGGYAWAENSYFFRLTPWHNDPVCDPPGEVLYLQRADDAQSGECWTPTPGPSPARNGADAGADSTYTVRHAPGITTFAHDHGGIRSELAVGMPVSDPVKISRLRLTNHTDGNARIALTSFVEWVLGAQREHTRHQIHTRADATTHAVFAQNFFADDFASRVAFSWVSEPLVGFTANREEFIGRNGDLAVPAGLRSAHLSETTGAAIDPCAALRCVVDLAPDETRDIIVLLGAAANDDDARAMIDRYGSAERANAALDAAVNAWNRRLSTIVVDTPAPEFNTLTNRWSLYQALSCRMWARSALYQSSGAFGFRDQLQDCMAFVYAEPGIARAHLLRSASRQFVEGDVQHWWHEPSGRGVRTRSSDDLVWLPFVADHYVRVSGDEAVWNEPISFLEQRPLAPDEQDAYELPTVSATADTLYAHCVRALDHACTAGTHGLPLMAGGDWNDGMNRVGVEGKGESVWLAWFLITTLRRMADHGTGRNDAAVATRFRQRADDYAAAVERSAWDGAWYRRAYFDDGTPLGSSENDECQIDAIAQSWAVISGAAPLDRARQAMNSLGERLVDDRAKLIMLLTPPFDRMSHDPGYIKGYVPGVRENGAQYTHGALWTALATARLGDGDRAFALYEMLNPFSHSRSSADVECYKVEPYAVCADVYTAAGHVGRGGWTWYTGSASWTYRIAIESILGLAKRGDTLQIDPCVPRAWKQFSIDYRHGETVYSIAIENPDAVSTGVQSVALDDRPQADRVIRLVDDRKPHRVMVIMGATGPNGAPESHTG